MVAFAPITACGQSQPDNVALIMAELDKNAVSIQDYNCDIYARELANGSTPQQAGAYLADLNWQDSLSSIVPPGGSTTITRGQWQDAFAQWHAENC